MNAIEYILEHNSLQNFLFVVAMAVALFFVLVAIRRQVRTRLARFARGTGLAWNAALIEMLGATRTWMLVGVSLLVASLNLDVPAEVAGAVSRVVMAMLFLQLGLWANRGVKFWLEQRTAARLAEADGAAITSMAILGFIARLVLWALIVILILDHLGFDVTALVASLGIGGVAVALAVQNILGDLFASLSIALDKPFVVGDFIIVGDVLGTVEYVGLKTTRIRSLSGEQIVMPNGDLLSSRVRNYKRMQERRIVFAFGVTYATPAEKLERLAGIVREAVEAQAETRFDRAHFKGFGASSLDFEVVYFVLQADFNLYMDIQQAINLTLVRRLAAEGIDFAFPTRTVHIASQPAPVAADADAPGAPQVS
jgi:small-conductance mechanosensitive channel